MWIVDNYRVAKWYYRDAPGIGDRVTYMDGTHTFVASISATHITLNNSLRMRRPYLSRRMAEWTFEKATEYVRDLQAKRATSSRQVGSLRSLSTIRVG